MFWIIYKVANIKQEYSWAVSSLWFECDFTSASRLFFFILIFTWATFNQGGVLIHSRTAVLMVNIKMPETVQRKAGVLVCDSQCFQDTSSTKSSLFESVGANELKGSFELPLNFPLLIEFTFLPTWAKTINQNSTKVKGDKAVNSYKKGLLSSLKSYDTVHGSMDYPISRLSNFPMWQSIECLVHEPWSHCMNCVITDRAQRQGSLQEKIKSLVQSISQICPKR